MKERTIKFSDLDPLAQVCWDRDSIPEWMESHSHGGMNVRIFVDIDLIPTVMCETCRGVDIAWWFEFVQCPEPRWRSNLVAFQEGCRGGGDLRDIW